MNKYNPLNLIKDRYLSQPGTNPKSNKNSSLRNKPSIIFINKDKCSCPNKKIKIYWEEGIGRVVKYLCPCLQKETNPLEESNLEVQ